MTAPQSDGEAEAVLRGSERLPRTLYTRVPAVLYEQVAREAKARGMSSGALVRLSSGSHVTPRDPLARPPAEDRPARQTL